MTYGINIQNANGVTQIDDQFRCLRIYSKGSTTLTQPYQVMTIDMTGVPNPIPFIRWTSFTGIFVGRPEPPFLRIAKNEIANQNCVVDWFVAGIENTTASTGYGLEIRNPSNQIVFTSNNEYARILDFSGRVPWIAQPGASGTASYWKPGTVNNQPPLNIPLDAYFACGRSGWRGTSGNFDDAQLFATSNLFGWPSFASIVIAIPDTVATQLGFVYPFGDYTFNVPSWPQIGLIAEAPGS